MARHFRFSFLRQTFFRYSVPVPVLSFFLAGFLLVLAVSCSQKPLVIGVLMEMDGSSAELGQAARNGILLAQEKNRSTGGPPVELVVKDIGSGTEKALAAAETLWDQGIRLYIGAYTSRQALALKDFMDRQGVLFISPAASSSDLSGKADHFFRVITSNDAMAKFMALRMAGRNLAGRVLIFQDDDNKPYTGPYADQLVKEITAGGGSARIIQYSSLAKPDFASLVPGEWKDAKAVACITNGADAGFIAQHLARIGIGVPMWGSAWSMSADAVRTGAQAVEGMEFIIPSDIDSPEAGYREFSRLYKEEFGTTPPFTATLGWEAFMLAAEWARRWGPDTAAIAPHLAQGLDFDGLTGKVHMDASGDVDRSLVPYAVKDGRFVRVPKSGDPAP